MNKTILVRTTKNLSKIGNSLAIFIPLEIVEEMGLTTNTPLTITLEKGKHGLFIAAWKKKK